VSAIAARAGRPGLASVVGGGVIGGGWVARLALNGVDVRVFDPDPEASRKVGSAQEAATGAAIIIEAVPERLDVKREVYAEIEKGAADDAIIASSTSGILPSDLQAEMTIPGRLLVAHPFNPVYLLPLVELVGGTQTKPDTITRASGYLGSLGMHPLPLDKEIEAFVADRFLEAVWREA